MKYIELLSLAKLLVVFAAVDTYYLAADTTLYAALLIFVAALLDSLGVEDFLLGVVFLSYAFSHNRVCWFLRTVFN